MMEGGMMDEDARGGGESGGEETALVPVRQQYVDFYGDGIPVAEALDGELYVALRPITDFLGLAFSPQRRRVLRDETLSARVRGVLMTAADGRQRTLLCVPLDLLPGWLFGVTPAQAKPEVREKLKRYRADCFRVLWEAFKGETAHGSRTIPATIEPGVSGAAIALEIATAVQHLARQQLDMEQRLADVAGTQTVMADYVRGFIIETNHRLTALERATATEATLTEAQAAEVSLAVKAVGQALQAAGNREGYAQVYAALYRRYRVSAYKSLPARSYEEVMDWLHRWYLEAAPPEASTDERTGG
jgi:hypothetical protein